VEYGLPSGGEKIFFESALSQSLILLLAAKQFRMATAARGNQRFYLRQAFASEQSNVITRGVGHEVVSTMPKNPPACCQRGLYKLPLRNE
jgi:hypothetical protein